METIITIILGILILVLLVLVNRFYSIDNEIIEEIKSRGHFVIEENNKGEQKVFFVSDKGEKTLYVPYKEDATSQEEANKLKEQWAGIRAIDPCQNENNMEYRVRYLESEVNRLWDYILKIR